MSRLLVCQLSGCGAASLPGGKDVLLCPRGRRGSCVVVCWGRAPTVLVALQMGEIDALIQTAQRLGQPGEPTVTIEY